MSGTLEVVTTACAMRKAVLAARALGRTVGLVPTMGALHAGHMSLVARSRARCDVTVATIFVNPTQFGPNEDFSRYPRTWDADLGLLRAAGVDFVFAPGVEEMYPAGATTMVEVGGVDRPLEGERRPGHFRGVATVVLKLFEAAPADVAFFGQKDYQQSLVIRRMVADLLLPIEIETCPIVREADGLAMSSRNVYLSAEERERALALSCSLRRAVEMHAGGERDVAVLESGIREVLLPAVDRLDYAVVVDGRTLEPILVVGDSAVALVAAVVGKTRLIDNELLAT